MKLQKMMENQSFNEIVSATNEGKIGGMSREDIIKEVLVISIRMTKN